MILRPILVATRAVLSNSNCSAEIRNTNAHAQWPSGIQQYGAQRFWTCPKTSLLNYNSIRLYKNVTHEPRSGKSEKSVNADVKGLTEVISVDLLQYNMRVKVETLRNLLAKNLSLKSTTAPVEKLPVIFQGNRYLLREIVKVEKTKNPMTVELNLSDYPQATPAVLQAIKKSGMNLNPRQHGTSIFLSPVPRITIEHKENLNRNAKALYQRCQGGIRDIETKSIKAVINKESDVESARLMENQIKLIAKTYTDEALEMLYQHQSELKKDDN